MRSICPVSIVTNDITPPSQVLSKGKVVDFGSQKFLSSADHKQTLNFKVTTSMVPSIRLLVYYILFGEGTSELVADSVWLDVTDKCVSGLQVQRDATVQTHIMVPEPVPPTQTFSQCLRRSEENMKSSVLESIFLTASKVETS